MPRPVPLPLRPPTPLPPYPPPSASSVGPLTESDRDLSRSLSLLDEEEQPALYERVITYETAAARANVPSAITKPSKRR